MKYLNLLIVTFLAVLPGRTPIRAQQGATLDRPRPTMELPGGALYGSYSDDGSAIVFESRPDGDAEIYRMNADGTALRRLTFAPGRDTTPVFSPGGQQIAFASQRTSDGGEPADGEIYVMDHDGANVRQLTDNDAEDGRPAWSPDGASIAFHSDRDGDREIFVMGADGSRPVQLTHNERHDDWATWSTDGAWILYEAQDADEAWAVRAVRPDGTGDRLFASMWAAAPSMSPDGSMLAYQVVDDEVVQLWVYELASGVSRQLTREHSFNGLPSWTIDSSEILFTGRRDGALGLFLIDPRGGPPIALTAAF